MITVKNITFNRTQIKAELTKGEVLAIVHALSEYKEVSAVGCDVYNALIRAMDKAETESNKDVK